MLSRRYFISLIMSFLLFWNKSATAQIFFKPKKKLPPRLRENIFTEGGKALVGVSGGGDVYPVRSLLTKERDDSDSGSSQIKDASNEVKEMIKEAVSLIGGFEKLAIKGKTVLVKPNVVSGEPNPATTNPQVVAAVVNILYEYGAAKVYVGDMSALATLSTLRNMKNNGIKKAAEENRAEVVIFEDFDWIEVELPRNQYVKTAYVTEWLYKTDLIINLPVIKTHRSASYSIALKNFIGCTHLKQRPYLIDSSHWEEIVAVFNAAYSPDLNIVDGTVSMIEGGPWQGTPADTNLIIASGDRVAADAVGLGIIKSFDKWRMVAEKDIWEQKQIKTAIELGIGNAKNNIKLLQGKGDEKFQGLMKKVKENTGIL